MGEYFFLFPAVRECLHASFSKNEERLVLKCPVLNQERHGNKALSFSAVAAYLDINKGQSAVHVTATVLTVTTLR